MSIAGTVMLILLVFAVRCACGSSEAAGEAVAKKALTNEESKVLLPVEPAKGQSNCLSEDTFTLFWTTRASEGLDFESQEQLNDVFRAAEESEFYFLGTELNPGMPVFKNRTTITALKGQKKVVNLKVVRVEDFVCDGGVYSVTYMAETKPEKVGKYLTIEDFRSLFQKLKESRATAKLGDVPPVRPAENSLEIHMQRVAPEESEDLIQG